MKCFQEEQVDLAPTPKKRSKRYSWAELLARTFQIDTLKCECGGNLKIISAILKGEAIRRILMHLGLPDRPPDIWPSQVGHQLEF